MRKFVPIMLIAALAVGVIVFAYRKTHRAPRIEGPAMSVLFLTEDLGNSIVLKTPEGDAVVIDPPSGRASVAFDQMIRDAHARGITVVLSDPSTEDVAVLARLQHAFGVRWVIRSELGAGTDKWEALLAKASETPLPELVLVRGDIARLSPTVRLQALSPAKESAAGDDSFVYRITFRDKSILFLSNLGAAGEAELTKCGLSLASNVMVAGRNAQYPSSSLELIASIRPEIVVISARGGSKRPSAGVIERLGTRNTGADLYRTDTDGIVRIDTDGRSFQTLTGGGEP